MAGFSRLSGTVSRFFNVARLSSFAGTVGFSCGVSGFLWLIRFTDSIRSRGGEYGDILQTTGSGHRGGITSWLFRCNGVSNTA